MRLFTAVWPGPEAAAALEAALVARPPWPPDGGWRPVPPERRHVTLAFHGEDEPGPRARALDAALAGMPAPRLRLAGLGTFPGVLWIGVHADGPEPALRDPDLRDPDLRDPDLRGPDLRDLAVAAGADPATFRPHLTLARRSRGVGSGAGTAPVAGTEPAPGPWWTPVEVLLVRSDTGRGGPVYTPVHRVPLALERT